MYYLILLIFLISLFFMLFFHNKKKKIIAKIRHMKKADKCFLLNEITEPFGYCYRSSCRFFSTTLNAWQREFGYTYLYDKMAPRLHMVFQSQPVYFDYDGKTWLIEFWKGQYGINTGGEIGIYHTDRIIPPEDYKKAVFSCADNKEMLELSFLLYNQNGRYVWVHETQWWLTAFLTGCFSKPSELYMEASITFPDTEMLHAFENGMLAAGYSRKDFYTFGRKANFTFYSPQEEDARLSTRIRCLLSQFDNWFFCKLYLFITRPFWKTEDQILYLYYYIPFAFRKILRLHRFPKRKKRCRRTRS